MRLGSSIQKHVGFSGVAAVGGQVPHQFFLAKLINSWTIFFQNFKSVHIYMKHAECAEINAKWIFRFLVYEIWSFFYSNLDNISMNFEYKINHNSKNMNLKNLKIEFTFISAHCTYFSVNLTFLKIPVSPVNCKYSQP